MSADGGDCRGCSATGWRGRVAAIHHGRCSVAGCPSHSRWRLSGRCADQGPPGRAGEILGRLGDRAAAGRRDRQRSACKRSGSAIPTCWHGGDRPWGALPALARLERDAALDPKSAELAFQRLRLVADAWHEIEPSEPVRENTVRFFSCACAAGRRCAAARRGLRCCGTPSASLQVVTLDDRLADAMRREGFALVDIAAQ